MPNLDHLRGVFAASLTPLHDDDTLALDDLAPFLGFLAQRGCHGALILGTTGEGPAFSPDERHALLRAAVAVRRQHPAFRLLAGSGTPSLDETVLLTRQAFDLGYDGVVVLPPYYFRKVSDEGLFQWFSQVIRRAVPDGGAFFGYHIPGMTGVGLSLDLLARLKDAFPQRFAGLKDSSTDPATARALGERFGDDLLVYNGTDSLFSLALENHAGGCITAMANLRSPDARRVWDGFQAGAPDAAAQARLDAARAVMDSYPPNPPLYKALLPRLHGLPRWAVRPPLLPLSAAVEEQVLQAAQAAVPEGAH
ncbi:MAG: dihydrodipicolinate synthase family protein [Chloroflexota bacterium]